MRTIATIENEDIVEHDDGSVCFTAKAAIDSDGVGPHHGDHTAQDQTSYKPDLNADIDRYIVVPPAIRNGVKGVVMGCLALVVNMKNGKHTAAVVGDIGPHAKLGEISCATASAIGLNPSPVSGGTDSHVIKYVLFPGIPAVVEGKTYHLQPA
jgi:Fungal chitosanase of glycosyl hydrolase group 75